MPPKTFSPAKERFDTLADHGEDYLYPLVAEHVVGWPAGGLLDLLAGHHRALAAQVAEAAGRTPAMLRKIADDLPPAADGPSPGCPPSDQPDVGDDAIGAVVADILGVPATVWLPDLSLHDPLLQTIWDTVFADWLELSEYLALLLTGDWTGACRAGEALCAAGGYWQGLSDLSRQTSGAACELYADAARTIQDCGRTYRTHTHACYLLFREVNGILATVPDDLTRLVELLDEADKAMVSVVLAAARELATEILDKIVAVLTRVLLVLRLIEAVADVVRAAVPRFTSHTNEMRAALTRAAPRR